MTKCQWHQLDHMQIICTLLQTDNHANTSSLIFYRPDALPGAQPCQSTEGRNNNNNNNNMATSLILDLSCSRNVAISTLSPTNSSSLVVTSVTTRLFWSTVTRFSRFCRYGMHRYYKYAGTTGVVELVNESLSKR